MALLLPSALSAQSSPKLPNSNASYLALRGSLPAGNGVNVQNFDLKREVGLFHFKSGTFYFFAPVAGRTTGAIFVGTGNFEMAPHDPAEKHSLSLILKGDSFQRDFTTLALRFTDDTEALIRKASIGETLTTPAAISSGQELQRLFRNELLYNVEARLLQDIDAPGGFFLATFKGQGAFSKRYLYVLDPYGVYWSQPDEIALLSSGDEDYDVTVGLRLKDSKGHEAFSVKQQDITTKIEKNGKIAAQATTQLTIGKDGVRVLPFHLYPTLRVSAVTASSGEALDFIQESKDHYSQFAVVLSKAGKQGDAISIKMEYAGPDVVENLGNGNYYPIARTSWYPSGTSSLGSYVDYHLTFTVPKGLKVIATGKQVREVTEGNTVISEWKTDIPIAVAGFNIGDFKQLSGELPDKSLKIDTFANKELPDYLQPLRNGAGMGTLNTLSMQPGQLADGAAALQVYTDYFGKLPYDHVSLTQQGACTYGQAWPMLVFLPICGFFDSQQLHMLGLDRSDPGFWNEVTAHEVAHQWWGQMVGFDSYRDQWMSEGFADFSTSLFLLHARRDMKGYQNFWETQRRRILEKVANGKRAVDVGPVTMGVRLNSSAVKNDIYQRLVYGKGAYILHMLEMLYYDSQSGEMPFKRALQDFCATYRNKPATTEDFKTAMEKDLPPWMDLDGNKKLDWFFDAYVYGTTVPHYTIESSLQEKNGSKVLHFKLTQSGVPDTFRMLVPLYIDLGEGKQSRLGVAHLHGNTSTEKDIPVPANVTPKRVFLNAFHDLLSD
ncbi:M1 family metallopeptidase [Terriglobus albidus]|uniref:M1 family metallopeptidase n=1 Tax=Terriglobus albidus TaxID=1592106 RepID=UPI0021DF9FFF|nr:M1 family aminopeptidase [Terriglobus albidus]